MSKKEEMEVTFGFIRKAIESVAHSDNNVRMADIGRSIYEIIDKFMDEDKNPKIRELIDNYKKKIEDDKANIDEVYFNTVLMVFNSIMTTLYVNFVQTKEEQEEFVKEHEAQA